MTILLSASRLPTTVGNKSITYYLVNLDLYFDAESFDKNMLNSKTAILKIRIWTTFEVQFHVLRGISLSITAVGNVGVSKKYGHKGNYFQMCKENPQQIYVILK